MSNLGYFQLKANPGTLHFRYFIKTYRVSFSFSSFSFSFPFFAFTFTDFPPPFFFLIFFPGIWTLSLAEGQASAIYKFQENSNTLIKKLTKFHENVIHKGEGEDDGEGEEEGTKMVVIDSWRASKEMLVVKKR